MISGRAATPLAEAWVRARFVLELRHQALETSSLVTIQRGRGKPSLFLVHGVGGGMLWGYANLARALGAEQPVYAFKSRGLDGLEEFTTIEEMAAQYVADLLRFQPAGPFYLGGYCFGGLVAYEMARQLKAQGHETALLLLLNCWPNHSSYTRVIWTPTFLAKFFWNLAVRLRLQMRYIAKRPNHYFKWRTAWLHRRIAAFCSQNEERVIGDKLEDLRPGSQPDRSLWLTHVRAWLRFVPKPYDGKIVLLRTQGHPLICSFDPQMGWGSFASGGVNVRICEGDHESILEEENAPDAAWHVREILDEVQTRRHNT